MAACFQAMPMTAPLAECRGGVPVAVVLQLGGPSKGGEMKQLLFALLVSLSSPSPLMGVGDRPDRRDGQHGVICGSWFRTLPEVLPVTRFCNSVIPRIATTRQLSTSFSRESRQLHPGNFLQ